MLFIFDFQFSHHENSILHTLHSKIQILEHILCSNISILHYEHSNEIPKIFFCKIIFIFIYLINIFMKID